MAGGLRHPRIRHHGRDDQLQSRHDRPGGKPTLRGIASATFTYLTAQTVVGFTLDDVSIRRGSNAADLDQDGLVGGTDLATLLGAWGPCGSQCCSADFNFDGQINAADLAVLLGAWG